MSQFGIILSARFNIISIFSSSHIFRGRNSGLRIGECRRMKVTRPLDEPRMDQGSESLGHVQTEWTWRLIHNRYTCVISTWPTVPTKIHWATRDIPETFTSRTRYQFISAGQAVLYGPLYFPRGEQNSCTAFFAGFLLYKSSSSKSIERKR